MTGEMAWQEVEKSYGQERVLHKFSARVAAGETLALLGGSGRGKTTCLRIMLGLEKPDAGRVQNEGVRFGCVFQEDRLCPEMSAVQNLRLVLPRAMWPNAEQALQALGLCGEDLEKPTAKLSGGQKRRVALARAVEYPCDALLLDEPLKGLDEENKRRAIAYLQQKQNGRSRVLVTHDNADAKALSARCLWLPSYKKQEGQGEETAVAVDIISEGR